MRKQAVADLELFAALGRGVRLEAARRTVRWFLNGSPAHTGNFRRPAPFTLT